MTPAERALFDRVQAVLAAAGAVHRQRGEEFGELFAAPLDHGGWGSGDRRRTLEELIALKTARLRSATSPARRLDSLLDLVCYQTIWLALTENEDEDHDGPSADCGKPVDNLGATRGQPCGQGGNGVDPASALR